MRLFGVRFYPSRPVVNFLLILILFIGVQNAFLSEDNNTTLVLDNERHLFIRLFKSNDPTRKTLRPFRILSGSLHYFRLRPHSWSQTIQQMKAAGLNTIETYVPWNIHEQQIGQYHFDDLIQFLNLVHQHEMFTIVRPSGYICAEWDWGGLPSWLLEDDNMRVRSTYSGFIDPLRKYYSVLLPILSKYQYNRQDEGSIIAFQIENEYGGYGEDKTYLQILHSMYTQYGLDELLFTSDGRHNLQKGALDSIWATVSFQRNITLNIDKLTEFRPNNHIMIAEYWTGWFDYWGGEHQTGSDWPYDAKELEKDLEDILLKSKYEISINFYMFIGGTNFGFTSGAHHFPNKTYSPMVTSYDYDAPISESGELTNKYFAIQNVITQLYKQNPHLIIYNHQRSTTDTFQINPIKSSKKVSFGKMNILEYMTFDEILSNKLLVDEYELDNGPLSMEQIKKHSTSQGFIIYTNNDMKDLLKDDKQQQHSINIKQIADNAIILVNDEKIYESNHTQNGIQCHIPSNTKSLRIIVENMGRSNYGLTIDSSRKGILDDVLLDETTPLKKWLVHLLEFRSDLSKLTKWKKFVPNTDNKATNLKSGPHLFHSSFQIDNEESLGDTFLLLDSKWSKGVAFVNGFNVGRYWTTGPQKTLYIPKDLLRKGSNDIYLFELYTSGNDIQLVDKSILN